MGKVNGDKGNTKSSALVHYQGYIGSLRKTYRFPDYHFPTTIIKPGRTMAFIITLHAWQNYNCPLIVYCM